MAVYTQEQAVTLLRQWSLTSYNIELTNEILSQLAQGINYTGGPLTDVQLENAKQWGRVNLLGGGFTIQEAAQQLRVWGQQTYNYSLTDAQLRRIAEGVGYVRGAISETLIQQMKTWAVANVAILAPLGPPIGPTPPPTPPPATSPPLRAKIQSIVDDTTAILTTAWTNSNQTRNDVRVLRLRPMGNQFNEFKYGEDADLGSSGLKLRDMLKNFTSPVVEVPRVNTAMLTFGLGTPLLGGDDGDGCGGQIPDRLSSVRGEVEGIINSLAGSFNLTTDRGAGEFMEAVACAAPAAWGLWRKTGGKQWNNHSVELLVYKSSTPLYNGKYYQFVDVISGQGGSGAKAGFGPTCEPFGSKDGESNWFKPSNCGAIGGTDTPVPGENNNSGPAGSNTGSSNDNDPSAEFF